MISEEYQVDYGLHRSRIDIMNNILRVASEGARKTRIMYKCNLSFKQMHAYINLLVSMGLLESVPPKLGDKNDSNLYETTKKGQVFIQVYRNLIDLCTAS